MPVLTLPKRLATRRVVLRPCIEADRAAFVAFMADDLATQYLLFEDEQKTPEGANALLDFVLASYAGDEPMFVLTIADRATDAYVGSCGMSSLSDGNVECYYTVIRERWGEGLATESVGALLDYVLGDLALPRVVAYASPLNAASHRVAAKVGMTDLGMRTHPDSGAKGRAFEISRA